MDSYDKTKAVIFCTLIVCVPVVFCYFSYERALKTEQAIKAGLQQKKVDENDIKSLTD